MSLLANPLFIRMAAVFLIGAAAFVVGVLIMRALRRQIMEDSSFSESPIQEDTLYPYTAVIQQLKQQKFELQNEQQQQRRRAKASEHMAGAVIANLPCGVLFVAPNGLVKHCNAAARHMLGFASQAGMSIEALFRNATGVLDSGDSIAVTEAFRATLQERSRCNFEASYSTAQGVERALGFRLIPLNSETGETSGLAAVITDESASADFRRAKVLHCETSAEMALALRSSVAVIRECAYQMVKATDRNNAEHLAKDISAEAERLDKVVGGFLAGTAASAVGA